MKFFIILSAVAAVALAKPGYLHLEPAHHIAHITSYAAPQAYVKLVPGAPIGDDGRVVDTPEVSHAKAEHHAAHINEKITLANEAVKSADVVAYAAAPAIVASSYHSNAYHSLPVASGVAYHGVHHNYPAVAYTKLVPAAPLGHDGRVVDTPEVAHAKAEHVAAHINEKFTLAHEEAKSSHYAAPSVHLVSAHHSGAYAPHYYNGHNSGAHLVSLY